MLSYSIEDFEIDFVRSNVDLVKEEPRSVRAPSLAYKPRRLEVLSFQILQYIQDEFIREIQWDGETPLVPPGILKRKILVATPGTNLDGMCKKDGLYVWYSLEVLM